MLWETVKLAMSSIRRNVLRSVLTLLGIVIGVGAVIAGPPALDREFQTIDFLTILDLAKTSVAGKKHFLKEHG